MKTLRISYLAGVAFSGLCMLAAPARAQLAINYSVGEYHGRSLGDTIGSEFDKLDLAALTGQLSLCPNQSVVAPLNNYVFTIGINATVPGTTRYDASRSITLNSTTSTLHHYFDISIALCDTITYLAEPTTAVDLPGVGVVEVTPVSMTTACTREGVPTSGTISGSFVLYDTAAPTINQPTADTSALWPPNHRLVDVGVSYSATDLCAAPVCTLSATSNEPDNGLGDGDTAGDIQVVDAHHVRLRAERAGLGTGRIYTLTVTCVDSSGNSTSKSTTVAVPHNM